jgi:ribonuclease J
MAYNNNHNHSHDTNPETNTAPQAPNPNSTSPYRKPYNSNFQNSGNNFRPRNNYQGNRPNDRDNNNRSGYGQRNNDDRPAKAFGRQIPEQMPGTVRVIPLGGVEEVGRNMTMFEIGEDIIVVDMGFSFKDEAAPGVDYVLPNTEYLETRKHKIRGVIITHGHLDHIGAIPYLMEKLGNPPMYCRNFTSLMIKKRQEEFPQLAPLNINVVEQSDKLQLGALPIRFFAVSHSIPDAMGVIIDTPLGAIVHTGDLRLDHDDGVPSPLEEEVYSVFKNEKVLLLLSDSTNSENPGFSISDRLVIENIEKIITQTSGRLIGTMFSTQIDRLMGVLMAAERLGKKVVIDGRSMKTNIELIKVAGLLKVAESTLITVEDMYKYPDNKIVMLVTGAQGDEFGSLMRIATKTHKYIAIKPNDTILMSSSIIPGNERGVQRLKDYLSRQCDKIIHYKTSDIHSSGHANKEEQAWIIAKIAPKFFMPIHGYHYMLRVHGNTAETVGVLKENVIISDNGSVIDIASDASKFTKHEVKAPSGLIFVDGFAVGSMQEVVLRDRQTLSQEGVFVTAVVVDSRSGRLVKSPDIASRGFVYLKESQELLRQVRLLIRKKIEDNPNILQTEIEDTRNDLNDTVSKFFTKKTGKSPIVMSIVIII